MKVKKIWIKKKEDNIENLSFYENEIINNEETFFNAAYSGSLFSEKKIITINESSDKIFKKINDVFERGPKNVFFIVISDVLEKKSKLRDFFEKSKNTICIPCYLDNEKDLQIILQLELKKNNITLSREAINLLVEKSNFSTSQAGKLLGNRNHSTIIYSVNKIKEELSKNVQLKAEIEKSILQN